MHSVFSFPWVGCLTWVEELSLPYYLAIARKRTDGFMPFPRALVQSEMHQSHPGFELGLPRPFPLRMTLNVSPKDCKLWFLYHTSPLLHAGTQGQWHSLLKGAGYLDETLLPLMWPRRENFHYHITPSIWASSSPHMNPLGF